MDEGKYSYLGQISTKGIFVLAASLALTHICSAYAQSTPSAPPFITVNPQAVITQSAAFVTAEAQLKTRYAAVLEAVTKQRAEFQAEDAASLAALKVASDKNSLPKAALEAKAKAILAHRQKVAGDIEKSLSPVKLAEEYVLAQIRAHLESASRTVMVKRGAYGVFTPASAQIVAANVDATADVVSALNAELPQVRIDVPTGWQPGQALPK